MATRRMFSKAVVNSARFLRMPQTSRLLYYDLGMAADDDGVVEAFTVIRTTGAAEDDLRVLHSRGFVIILNDDLVSYISDWKRNNSIRADRYTEGVYKDLLVKVVTNSDAASMPSIPTGNQMATNWQPNDNQMEPQVSIVKDSIVKESRERGADKPPRARFVPPTVDEVRAYCLERHNSVSPERFVDYYTSKGWKVGNSSMKDWRAAVRTWENRDKNNSRMGDITDPSRYIFNEEDSL